MQRPRGLIPQRNYMRLWLSPLRLVARPLSPDGQVLEGLAEQAAKSASLIDDGGWRVRRQLLTAIAAVNQARRCYRDGGE